MTTLKCDGDGAGRQATSMAAWQWQGPTVAVTEVGERREIGKNPKEILYVQ